MKKKTLVGILVSVIAVVAVGVVIGISPDAGITPDVPDSGVIRQSKSPDGSIILYKEYGEGRWSVRLKAKDLPDILIDFDSYDALAMSFYEALVGKGIVKAREFINYEIPEHYISISKTKRYSDTGEYYMYIDATSFYYDGQVQRAYFLYRMWSERIKDY